MEKTKRFFAVALIGLLCAVFGRETANAQTGVYSVMVTTPGTLGQVMLKTVENWSDVVELTLTGHLNMDDMGYFSRMQNMTKLDLSGTDITSVSGCESLGLLKTVVLPETVTVVSGSAFNGCTALTTINLEQIEEIEGSAFNNCKSLTGTLTLDKVITLGEAAFNGCEGLTGVEMPLVTEIGVSAFSGCTELVKAVVPNVKWLGSYAFYGCEKLLTIDLSKCVYFEYDMEWDNGGNQFSYCRSLTEIMLSDDLEDIPQYSFARTGLKTIKLPKNLKSIGAYAFEDSKLSAIDIPEGVTNLNSYDIFRGCPLETITLPMSLTRIGNNVFSSKVLKDVYCRCVVPIETSVFNNNNMAKSATLHVPALSVGAYKLDANWGLFNKIEAIEGDLTDVTINNSFTIIDFTGLADNANLALATGGHLSVSADNALSLNNFTQNQSLMTERKGEYGVNGNYVYRYSYPYCTTLIANSEVRANSVTTRISMPTNSWSFISMPYDVNVSDITVPDGTMWVVRKYNGSNRAAMTGDTWEDVTAGQMLNAGEGYIFHCINGNNDFVEFEFPAINNANKNNVFTTDDVMRTLKEYPAEFSHNRGWNLTGNPYAAYFNSRHIDFPAPITVWNGSGYTAYSLIDDEYVLHPNEAFFVQCPLNANQIKFMKDGRMHSHDIITSSGSRVRGKASDGRTILNFVLADDSNSDRTRLVLNDAAICDYETERDASKFMSSRNDVPQIYIVDNSIHYAIDERPLGTGEYVLGIRAGKAGNHRISLNMNCVDYEVVLTDKESGVRTDLTHEAYAFDAAAKTYNDRFAIRITAKNGQDAIDDVTADGDAPYSINGNVLSVDGEMAIMIHTVDGRLIHSGTVTGPVALTAGMYVLTINGKTHKIVIK